MKTTVTFTVHTTDAAQVAQWFEAHGAEISAEVDRAAARRRRVVTWQDRAGITRRTLYYGNWLGALTLVLILLALVLRG
jgi:hypothetical protein